MSEEADREAIDARIRGLAHGSGLQRSGLARALGEGLGRLLNVDPDENDETARKSVILKFDEMIKSTPDDSANKYLTLAGALSYNISLLTERQPFTLIERQKCLSIDFRQKEKLSALQKHLGRSFTSVRNDTEKVYKHIADMLYNEWRSRFPGERFPVDKGNEYQTIAESESDGPSVQPDDYLSENQRAQSSGLSTGPYPPTSDSTAKQAALDLATKLRTRANTERRLRKVGHPFPLPVRWTRAPRHLADHPENIYRTTAPEEVRSTGNLDNILELFGEAPAHRLVVLGRAGAGKSILALEFVRSFLASEQDEATPLVPVLFSTSSWNPAEQSLRDWMTAELIAEFPELGKRTKSKQALAAELVRQGCILPVLDGFDEMAWDVRAYALKALNAQLSDDDPLLLTSRPAEYAEAVEHGDVLSFAAVIQLEDLTLDDIADYLWRSTTPAREVEPKTKWHPVIDRMRNSESDPAAATLLAVLNTPLMVSLARAAYSDTDDDPVHLLDRDEFPDATALSDHLLDSFVPAAYDHPPQDAERGRKKRRTWETAKAQRWLEFLALRTRSEDTTEITWWRTGWPIPEFVLLGILGVTCLASAVSVLFLGRDVGYIDAAVCGLFMGLSSGFVVKDSKGSQDIAIPLHGARAYIAIAIYGTIWEVDTVLSWIGLFLLIAFGLTFALHPKLLDPAVQASNETNPSSLMRTAIKRAIVRAVISAAVVTGLPLFACWLLFGTPQTDYRILLTIVLACVVGSFLGSTWVNTILTRGWLVITGRAPWCLISFLEDAHQRGVLRLTGVLYEFRHALLRDRLAASELDRLWPRAKERKPILIARAGLADSWLQLGRLEAADAEFRAVFDVLRWRRRPDRLEFYVRHKLSEVAWYRGDKVQAISDLRMLLDMKRKKYGNRYDGTRYTWLTLARALNLSGDTGEAVHELNAILKTAQSIGSDKPHITEARKLLAAIQQDSKRPEAG